MYNQKLTYYKKVKVFEGAETFFKKFPRYLSYACPNKVSAYFGETVIIFEKIINFYYA